MPGTLARGGRPFVMKGSFFISDWLFLWVMPLIARTRKTAKAALELFPKHKSEYNGRKLEKLWQEELNKAKEEER